MAITLAEAKATLSVYVDNGVYQDDSRVIARINEAQRRLYAVRSWLGVLAKYVVQVNAGLFVLPDYTGSISQATGFGGFGINTILRVTSSAIPISPVGAQSMFLTNSEQAFLADGQSIVKVSRDSSSANYRTYRVSGNASLVEITGKLQFQPAAADTDLLIIQDLDALRLMLLALWREQNGQLDLAQTFEAKAVERLSVVLDKTLEGARRLNYQSIITSSSPGTMGYMRARMALDLKDGLHTDDAVLFYVIDRAEEHLMTKGKWFGTIDQYTISVPTNGEIYLPNEVDSILFVAHDNQRMDLFAREYDFHENGPGYRTVNNDSVSTVVDRGEGYVLNNSTGLYESQRKYFVNRPDCGCAVPNTDIVILAKKRFVPKTSDSSQMAIKNYPAMLEMVTALMQTEKPDFYTFHENKAIELLRAELLEKRGGARLNMQVQGNGFAMGEIPHIL